MAIISNNLYFQIPTPYAQQNLFFSVPTFSSGSRICSVEFDVAWKNCVIVCGWSSKSGPPEYPTIGAVVPGVPFIGVSTNTVYSPSSTWRHVITRAHLNTNADHLGSYHYFDIPSYALYVTFSVITQTSGECYGSVGVSFDICAPVVKASLSNVATSVPLAISKNNALGVTAA